jgi:hypothetical protein
MQFEMSDKEAALLKEILEDVYGDLKGEIYKTEDTDFKAALKEREATLESLLKKLGAEVAG